VLLNAGVLSERPELFTDDFDLPEAADRIARRRCRAGFATRGAALSGANRCRPHAARAELRRDAIGQGASSSRRREPDFKVEAAKRNDRQPASIVHWNRSKRRRFPPSAAHVLTGG